MSRDYAEKEREFIESLKADTGRDLAGWMTAISEQNFPHRNDAIDWLRQQGFLFAWASWLERIHHNGGQPIYYDESATAAPNVPPPRQPVADAAPPPNERKVQSRREDDPAPAPAPVHIEGGSVIRFPGARTTAPPPSAPQPARRSARLATSPGAATSPEVMSVIAAAKAYAPLAGFLIRCISDQLPGTALRAGAKHVEMRAGPLPFALLAVGGKELKLAFAGPPDRFEKPVEKSRLPNLGEPLSPLLTHMIVLSDAREIDDAFVEMLRQARARVAK